MPGHKVLVPRVVAVEAVLLALGEYTLFEGAAVFHVSGELAVQFVDFIAESGEEFSLFLKEVVGQELIDCDLGVHAEHFPGVGEGVFDELPVVGGGDGGDSLEHLEVEGGRVLYDEEVGELQEDVGVVLFEEVFFHFVFADLHLVVDVHLLEVLPQQLQTVPEISKGGHLKTLQL